MKKIILLLLLFSLATGVSAKRKFGIDLGIGLKGGLNFNKIDGLGWKDTYHTDPHAGFFIYLNKRRLGFQLEALWSQHHMVTDSTFKGLYSQYLQNADDSISGGSFRFNNIAIPILLNIKLANFLWIQLGPQFNSTVNVIDKNNILQSGKTIINQQNYSAVGGIWVQIGGDNAAVRVNLGARYVAGLNNINTLNNIQVWKSQAIQLHLGISY